MNNFNRSKYIGSAIFKRQAFGNNHPLAFSRHSSVLELCHSLGWLPEEKFIEVAPTPIETLLRFHGKSYVAALKNSVDVGKVSVDIRDKYNIGTMENPIFDGLFERAATTVAGSIKAAELVCDGGVVFHPSGGTHHGRPNKASGFCYFNDPVFAVLTLLDQGLSNIVYIDVDAHHGDGVQDAFADDKRVSTFSIHEDKRWPYSGAANDHGGGRSYNFSVPSGVNDTEYSYIFDNAILPAVKKLEPEAIVITCGADALQGDPLSSMNLSNAGLWSAVLGVVNLSSRSIVLGGGGYNPWTTTRCWAGLWGKLSGQNLPEVLPENSQNLLKIFESDLVDEEDVKPLWLTSLADKLNEGEVRLEVKKLVSKVMSGR
jgi:acetoin utilization protein AcuC